MRDSLFYLPRVKNISIQSQIREMLVSAILGGQLPPDMPLPSSRKMAKTLGVSRNTVVLSYQGLVDDGYLMSRERSGFYVDPAILEGRSEPGQTRPGPSDHAPDWERRLKLRPSLHHVVSKPLNWQTQPYPFISNQVDQNLFPIAAWRECTRQSMGIKGLDAWTSDTRGYDEPMLVEQIRTRLLPRRGILASDDEILITLGAQNALYILSNLLIGLDSTVAIENPGYPDARNIFKLATPHTVAVDVDHHGLPTDQRLPACDYVYVTPSHQAPTTVTMPMERRKALLERAAKDDFIIIEDDYEAETNYISTPSPALKSLDNNDRVIYIGSLSKTLFPGLRLGYLVASKKLIHEAWSLRLNMLRHTPNNNQRTTALFLSLGHHEALIHRLHKVYRQRWQVMKEALDEFLPNMAEATFGGTSFWLQGPEQLNSEILAKSALENGIVIEPGALHFADPNPPQNYIRLGLSSINSERIPTGIQKLSQLMEKQLQSGATQS